PSSSEMVCWSWSGSVALTNCPGLRRNTAQSVYSVSPDAGVVTGSGKGLAEGAELVVMGSIILWWGIGICEFAEFLGCAEFREQAGGLLSGLSDDGRQPDADRCLPNGDDTVRYRC